MGLPFVIGAIIATRAIGSAINTIGARRAARGVEREGEMERELFGRNASILEEQADDAIARGHEAAFRQRSKIRQTSGDQTAAFAGQGVDVGFGSAGAVVTNDRRLGEFDEMMVRENAAREALGYRRQASIMRDRGNLAYTGARNRAKSMRWGSVGSMVNFTGDMLDLYNRNS